MATDIDTLKILQSIEKLLQGASVLAGSKTLNSADRNKQTTSQKAGKDAKKIYQATADRAKELGDTVMGLNKSLFGLNTQVGNVTTSFGSLHSQMSKFMSSLTPITVPDTAAPGVSAVPMNQLMEKLILEAQQGHASAVKMHAEQASIGNLSNSYLKVIAGATAIGAAAEVGSMPSMNQQGAALVSQLGKGITKGTKPVVKDIDALNIPFKAQLGRMIDDFGRTSSALGGLGVAASNVKDILKKLTGDFFSLASVGMGTIGNLTELSKNAMLSGMSLKEYQAVIKDNIAIAARAGSLDNFNKIISAADSQLASMGVFGMESRQMQASLAESSTMMGVKQGKLTDVIAAQISVFDDLRKSTNMTAEEFAGLVKDLSNNEQVQRELLGLAPQQRIARQQELLNVAAIGSKMGLAADASKQLADALLAQRGETVKGRIETMGRVRQLGQLTGMGAEGERAGQLLMKGRNRTDADEKELADLADKLNKAGESAYQTGSLGVQNALDFFNETLGGTKFGQVMKAVRPAGLAQDSGKVNQEAFGKHVGDFGKFTGELLKYVRGWNEGFGPMIAGLIGGVSLALFRGPIIKALQAGAGKLGIGTAGATAAGGEGVGMLAKAFQSFKSADLLAPIKAIPSIISSAGEGVMTSIRGARAAVALVSEMEGPAMVAVRGLQGLGPGLLKGATAVRGGLAAAAGALANFPLVGGLISAAFEMFTGDIAAALNPDAGIFDRIGGIVTSFFSALPQFIIDVLGTVLGPGLTGNLQNGFDQFVAAVSGAIRSLFSGIFGAVSKILGFILPDDSPLVKSLAKWSQGAQDSADQNFKVMDDLANDHGKTLSSISADNKAKAELATKAAAGTTEATQKATVAQSAFNNVQSGLAVSQASMMSDAAAIIATPQVQVPTTVKPATVNTPDEQTTPSATKLAQAAQVQGNSDLLTALNSILTVMRDTLASEQRQVELAEMLLRSNRPQASFPSAEATANLLLKGQAS
jgi:hypothetical protein